MALPNPPTSPNSSKLFAVNYDNAGANAAATVKAIGQTTVNSEVMGHMAVATAVDNAAYSATSSPVVLIAGQNGGFHRTIATNASGHVSINDGSNSITVDGSVSISGTPNVSVTSIAALAAGTNNIGDVDILTIAAGTNTIGGTLDPGWDNAAKAPRQAMVTDVSATSAQTLEAADASNLFNIYSLWWSFYSGSDAPVAVRSIKFRFASGGTTFYTVYVPPTANVRDQGSMTVRIPIRTAVNNSVDVILSGALGAGGVYSAGITSHKSTS